jgi:hypothetical protein
VESYLAQFLEDKCLSGIQLTKEEQEFLAWYNQANDELFAEWLEAVY